MISGVFLQSCSTINRNRTFFSKKSHLFGAMSFCTVLTVNVYKQPAIAGDKKSKICVAFILFSFTRQLYSCHVHDFRVLTWYYLLVIIK